MTGVHSVSAPSTVVRQRLRVVGGRRQPDRDGVRRAVTDLLTALGRDPADAHLAETPRRVADATPSSSPTPVRPDNLRERRAVRRADPGPRHPDPLVVPAPPAALLRGCTRRLSARQAHPGPVQTRPRGGPVRPRPAASGATHSTDRRLAPDEPGAQGCRRGDRGRAPVHVPARGACRGGPHPRPCTVRCGRTTAPARSSSLSPSALDEPVSTRRARVTQTPRAGRGSHPARLACMR